MKEKKNITLIVYGFVGFILLAVAVGMLVYRFDSSHPKTIYQGDETPSSETVLLDIYGISSTPIITVDDDTEVWLVQYKDGYAGLQAKENDPQITKLLQNNENLEKKPQRIVGKFMNTSNSAPNKNMISQYYDLINEMAASESTEFKEKLADNTYVSLTEFQSGQTSSLITSIIFFALSALFFGIGLITRKRVIAAYNEVYSTYPELENNINTLYEQADFRDDELKIAIYKQHLITYYGSFSAVDLTNVEQIYHYIFTVRRYGIAVKQASYLRVVRQNQKKPLQMPIRNIKKTTDSKLQSTFDYLYQHFPYIKLGI
ncbi:MAG: hypothetical protein Q4A90_04785 [Streptococcus sp.]|nr:hypothetical protein [Streptococcus sp.]